MELTNYLLTGMILQAGLEILSPNQPYPPTVQPPVFQDIELRLLQSGELDPKDHFFWATRD